MCVLGVEREWQSDTVPDIKTAYTDKHCPVATRVIWLAYTGTLYCLGKDILEAA